MKVIAVFALSLSQLVVCQRPPFVLEYNCTTDGIPTVVIVAGEGVGQPSIVRQLLDGREENTGSICSR
jgi:hypothetical protein